MKLNKLSRWKTKTLLKHSFLLWNSFILFAVWLEHHGHTINLCSLWCPSPCPLVFSLPAGYPGAGVLPPDMYGQQVGIFKESDHIGLYSLVEGLDCPLGPAQGVLCHLPLLYFILHVIRRHHLLVLVLLGLPVCYFPYRLATDIYSTVHIFRPFWHELTLWLLQYCNYYMIRSLKMQRLVIHIRLCISLRTWVPGLHFLVLQRGWW